MMDPESAPDPPSTDIEAVEQVALRRLFEQRTEHSSRVADRIDAFCIPRFAASGGAALQQRADGDGGSVIGVG